MRYAAAVEKTPATTLPSDATLVAAEERRTLLSRLLAGLAHEIRNPLSSLNIHVQLLEEDLTALEAPIREKLSGRLGIIHGELVRLENIVTQFLSLAGPSSVNLQALAVGPVVEHVCALLQPEAAARGIELRAEVPAGLPPLSADPDQLKQALVNLVLNAVQAIGGTGRIEVRAGLAQPPDRLAIEVRDTGPGVPPERQTAIFEPFYTTKAEGVGLGLWIVQQIVSAHGGAVTVANGPAGGAVFTLNLPLAPAGLPDGSDQNQHPGGR